MACNGYPELCLKKYSNITHIGAHNSPFTRPNNVASNQIYGVFAQLNDGVRLLQGQTHLENGTLSYCHTSCDLLNAGPAKDYFTNVTRWLDVHPNDVVTLIIANGGSVDVSSYVAPLQSSGLANYAWAPGVNGPPGKVPMRLEDWPTLSDFIQYQKRAIIFLDSGADQQRVPYVLDQFSQMWETPIDPQDRNFPCTVQRPPGLNSRDARDRLYLANHNLNAEIQFGTNDVSIPDLDLLNYTNAVSGFGSLGQAAGSCASQWGRPPNVLLVDYYNYGNFPGSVFEVAARINGVQYKQGGCCGLNQQASDSPALGTPPTWILMIIILFHPSLRRST